MFHPSEIDSSGQGSLGGAVALFSPFTLLDLTELQGEAQEMRCRGLG